MNQPPRVKVLQSLQDLVQHVLLVHVLQEVHLNYRVQIRLHKVAHKVNIHLLARFRLKYILQLDYILVPVQLLQKHYLPVRSLRVRCALKGVEALFQRYNLLVLP